MTKEVDCESDKNVKTKPPISFPKRFWKGFVFLLLSFVLLVGLSTLFIVGRIWFKVNEAKPKDVAREKIDDTHAYYSYRHNSGLNDDFIDRSKPTALIFSGSSISDEDIAKLEDREDIAAIYLIDCPSITDACLDSLSRIPNLRRIALCSCSQIQTPDFSKLAVLNDLQRLCVRNCSDLMDESVQKIAELSSLKILRLTGCSQLTEKGILPLASLPLVEFAPPECLLKDETISNITRFEELRELIVAGAQGEELPLTDAGIMELASMKKLRGIRIDNCPNVSEDALKDLCKKVNDKRSAIYDWELQIASWDGSLSIPEGVKVGTYDSSAYFPPNVYEKLER